LPDALVSTKEKRAILTLTYVALAILGCGYVVISMFLGHFGSGNGGDGADGHAADHGGDFADGHGGDHGGIEYGVDGHGHGDIATSGDALGTFHFPFFSPLALATTLGALGAYGLIAQFGLRVSNQMSLVVAVPAAFATAYLVTYIGWRLAASSIGSSQIRIMELRGASAEVITPIPANGIGEIAAVVSGQRYTGPAREASGRAVPRGAHVTVKNLVGTTLVVVWDAP
jgi:membrane protein implicated in regulation of membrane protease activity